MNEDLLQVDSIIFKINKDSLVKYFNKLEYAVSGEITKPVFEMPDVGSTLFAGYIFDSKAMKYKQVLLRQIGTLYIENKSSEAAEIYNWLFNINSKQEK